MLDGLNEEYSKLLKNLFNQYLKNDSKCNFTPATKLHFNFLKSLQENGYIICSDNLDNCINDFIENEQNQHLQITFTDKFNKAFNDYKK